MFGTSSPDSLYHLIDANDDYGLWVRKAIEEWPGGETEILTSADVLSRAVVANTLSKGECISCQMGLHLCDWIITLFKQERARPSSTYRFLKNSSQRRWLPLESQSMSQK